MGKTINTGKKKFEVDNRKSQFEVCKTSEIHPETIVTQEWIEKAISEFESESSVSVNKMDFTLVSKGVYRAVIEAGVKALAKLHAISYAYFNRSSDSVKEFSEVLKLLVDHHYQPAATPEDKAEAKRMLEKMFEGIVTTMEKTSQVEQVKTMKNMLYNIYKEGRQSSSVFSVLCHGCPTVQNMVFLYNKEDIPVDAKLVNFSDARIASSMTDLHTFINTA